MTTACTPVLPQFQQPFGAYAVTVLTVPPAGGTFTANEPVCRHAVNRGSDLDTRNSEQLPGPLANTVPSDVEPARVTLYVPAISVDGTVKPTRYCDPITRVTLPAGVLAMTVPPQEALNDTVMSRAASEPCPSGNLEPIAFTTDTPEIPELGWVDTFI